MLNLAFTPAVSEALRYERFHHPHPRVQLKMETLYLRSQGVPAAQIQRLCVISKATYYRYLNEYRTGGLAHLKAVNVTPRTSELKEYRGTLEAYFLAHPRRRSPKPQPKSLP